MLLHREGSRSGHRPSDSLTYVAWSQEAATRTSRTFSGLGGALDERAVAAALRVGNRLRTLERLSRPELEIAWTGPEAEGPLIRSTAAILEEMVEGIRDAGEVLLVGYALTAETGTFMERVVCLLEDAARRRAKVVMILHEDDEQRNLENLMGVWDDFTKKPQVFTWRPSLEHPYTKLHAKCLGRRSSRRSRHIGKFHISWTRVEPGTRPPGTRATGSRDCGEI